MTKLRELNRTMLVCEANGDISNENYATYKQLLRAAAHLTECQELLRDYPWVYQECKRILKELK